MTEGIGVDMNFFTADIHANHSFIAKQRGFMDTTLHDNFIVNNIWNKTVGGKDTVYVLGDFFFGDHDKLRKFRNRLNGKIILILGNHDYSNRIFNCSELFSGIFDIKEVKIDGHKTVLCHYPLQRWPSSHYNSWHCYGHCHGGLQTTGKTLDVGLDASGMCILNEFQISAIITAKENNENYLGKV